MYSCSQQANKVLGMIKRNFVDRFKDTILALYKSLVRPNLEYCTPIWSPHLVKDIKLVEGVQQRAIKMVQGIAHWKYHERLEYLGLRLERQRVRCDLIETFKIMKGHYDVRHKFMIYGLNQMKVVELKEDMTRNCSRNDLDLTAENIRVQ